MFLRELQLRLGRELGRGRPARFPSESLLIADYHAAGETFGGGLSMPDLWKYWTTSGIDGLYLTGTARVNRGRSSVEAAILAHQALVVEDVTTKTAYIGTTSYQSGTAIMVADGFTPKGPLVVFQGHTIQMTWAQWNAQIRAVWQISVSTTAPSPSAPTATLLLSSSNVLASGATVNLTFSSTNATSCSLSSVPSLWSTGSVSVPCTGTYPIDVVASSAAQQWTFTFTATSATGQSATASQTLLQSAPAQASPAYNTSSNWSGYVVPSSSSLITDTKGDLVVPTLDCADTPNAQTWVWVGIGGEQWATGGSSGSLLQTGINSTCADGLQQNTAWWEVVPATPSSAELHELPRGAGDTVQAYVYQMSNGAWETLFNDVQTGLSALMVTGQSWGVGPTTSGSITYTIQGSAINISYGGAYTAEWIVEDPTATATQGLDLFANFGSVTFTNLEASFSTWSLTHDETWAIVQGGVTLATPTATTTDGFTVSYSGP